MATIGDRIRTRRHELGLTLRELACKGVTGSHINRIETGDRQPSMKALRALAPRLGVSVYWLETGRNDPSEELAQLVIEHHGRPLPERAKALARSVLKTRG